MAVKTYRYTTDEGMEVKVDLMFKGIEDGKYDCEDCQVKVKPSPGYVTNDSSHTTRPDGNADVLAVKTSVEVEG